MSDAPCTKAWAERSAAIHRIIARIEARLAQRASSPSWDAVGDLGRVLEHLARAASALGTLPADEALALRQRFGVRP